MKFIFECWKIFHEWAQRTSEIFSTREEEFCFSKWPCNVLLFINFYYINTNEIPNHFTETVLSCERRDLLCSHSNSDFSHVKITWYFDVWRYHVFTQKLSWYFIGVYIIIECILWTSVTNNNLLSSQNEMSMLNFFPIIFYLIHL